MKSLIAFNVRQWIEEYRRGLEPPVGNQVIWENWQFTDMTMRNSHTRRDFHQLRESPTRRFRIIPTSAD